MSDDEGSEWLIQILKDVQLEQFYVRIRDELQVEYKCKIFGNSFVNLFGKNIFTRYQGYPILISFVMKTWKKLGWENLELVV